MIYTSYFAKLRKMPENIIPIAICAKVPDWYKGFQYKKLAPKYEFFNKWKQDNDDENFIKCYKEQVLDNLELQRVLIELQCLLSDEIKIQMQSPFYSNNDWHIALVCYEKPSDFCHRHLVAEWLKENGYRCEEWEDLQ